MDKNAVWSLFEKTGSINAYLLYHTLEEEMQKPHRQEDDSDADENRRVDH